MTPLRCLLVLLSLVLAGCAGPTRIGARATNLGSPAEPTLDMYELADGRSAPPVRATVLYVPGSTDTSVTRAIGALAGFVMMDMRVLMLERRGVRGDAVDRRGRDFATKPKRIADVRAALDAALGAAPPTRPVVLVGASEGGDVAAAVAAEDPRVTHLVLLGSGGGMTQADELTLLVRRNPGYLGIRTEEDLAARFAEVRARPDSTEDWLGLPFCRWSSFLWSPPLPDLLRFRGHVLLVHGDRDDNVPVESARAASDAARRADDDRLRYVEVAGMDHRMRSADGRSMLPLVERDVVRWLADTGVLQDSEAAAFDRRVRKNHPEWFGR